jgi:hypothetical protein
MSESQSVEVQPVITVPGEDFSRTVFRLRNRAWLLRIQAFVAIGILVIASCAIAWIFMSLQRLANDDGADSPVATRPPYDYGEFESRHAAIATRLKELSNLLSDTRQELISDKYGSGGTNMAIVARHLQERNEELDNLRADLDSRIAKDREDMYREIIALRNERDQAVADSAEKRSYIQLVGEALMRIGVLVLAIYLTAIVSNIAKYWLRVADHLNAVADSLDLLHAARLALQPAIAALTPHPIDFQAEDLSPIKSARDLANIIVKLTQQRGVTR